MIIVLEEQKLGCYTIYTTHNKLYYKLSHDEDSLIKIKT